MLVSICLYPIALTARGLAPSAALLQDLEKERDIMLEFFRTIGDFIITTVENFMWQDLIDIAFVAVIIYFVLKFIRDTRAA